MEFFKANTKIDFLARRVWAAVLSTVLFVLSCLSMQINGLNKGLDFTGGTEVQLHFLGTANLNHIRDTVQLAGFRDATVISFGNSQDVLVTVAPKQDHVGESMNKEEITRLFPDAVVQKMDYIGPQVGQELAARGTLAVVIALLGTMLYIALRFEWRFGVGSTVALIHDPVLILGAFSFFHWEFNLVSLAAILTVIGYSLNDTIVIFDRVRENFRKYRKATPIEIVNQSINQTLSRTIMTSVLTLIVVLCLFLFGGSLLHGFALAMMIGIVVGTYSSIYVAGSLALGLGLKRQHLLPIAKEVLDERP